MGEYGDVGDIGVVLGVVGRRFTRRPYGRTVNLSSSQPSCLLNRPAGAPNRQGSGKTIGCAIVVGLTTVTASAAILLGPATDAWLSASIGAAVSSALARLGGVF